MRYNDGACEPGPDGSDWHGTPGDPSLVAKELLTGLPVVALLVAIGALLAIAQEPEWGLVLISFGQVCNWFGMRKIIQECRDTVSQTHC